METVSILEAQSQLAKLVDLTASGTDVVITREGTPEVRMTTLEVQKHPIVFGLREGEGWIANDFDAPLPKELQAAFEGR